MFRLAWKDMCKLQGSWRNNQLEPERWRKSKTAEHWDASGNERGFVFVSQLLYSLLQKF